ncbi:hypothetical protein SynBIOSE41_03745 [Synechococcus sp. BIOS-E4-1]|nr:hypothetical protein SynBIOSE41_03745 [Synechococcus sp. BIOS-E4-1]
MVFLLLMSNSFRLYGTLLATDISRMQATLCGDMISLREDSNLIDHLCTNIRSKERASSLYSSKPYRDCSKRKISDLN